MGGKRGAGEGSTKGKQTEEWGSMIGEEEERGQRSGAHH